MRLTRRFSSDADPNMVSQSIGELLGGVTLFSLATVGSDGAAYINNAYFAFDESANLYFISPPDAVHSVNISANSSAAASVLNTMQEGPKRGLQMFGRAELASGDSLLKGIQVFGARFAWFSAMVSKPADFETAPTRSRMYIVKVQRVKVFDERIFGPNIWVEAT